MKKKIIATVLIIFALLFTVFITVFILAKTRVIYLNKWFVNEDKGTIGVDISSYQENVDMKTLKNQNIAFVYIKATEGSSSQDSKFSANWENAKKADFLAGAYHFFSYDSPGKTQAENFIQTVGKDLHGRLIPAVDIEYYGDKEENPPKKEDVIRELTDYVQAIETEYGVKPLIYTGSDIYDKYLAGTFDDYKYWISSLYTPLRWNYQKDWYIWQYLNIGVLDGYSGGEKYIDLNILNDSKNLTDLTVK